MPVNPFFNQTSYAPEQGLIDDLIVEAIQIYGHSAYYIPREDANLDQLFGEDPLANYTDPYEIEIYLKNTQSFAGASEFISKFGLQIEDQATFLVSVRRFNEELGDVLTRPRENDILFIEFTPANRYLMQINFVENKEQLFQLGKLYTYELRCEMMNYSHERVTTGDNTIDAVAQRGAYTLDLTMGAGSGTYQYEEVVYQGDSFVDAVATGTVVSWANNVLSVQSITGTFVSNTAITGMASGAVYAPVAAPDTAPTSHDPIADNDTLTTQSTTVLINRGPNPRFS